MHGIIIQNENNNIQIKFIYEETPVTLNIPKFTHLQCNDPVFVTFNNTDTNKNPTIKIDKVNNFISKEVFLLELQRNDDNYQALFASTDGNFITVRNISNTLKERYISKAKQDKTFMYYNFDGIEYIDF